MKREFARKVEDISPIWLGGLYSGYVLILSFVYWRYVTVIFAYDGFYRKYVPADLWIVIVANIFLLIFLPKRNSLSSSLGTLMYLLIFAPTTVYVLLGPGSLTTLYVTTFAISIVALVSTRVRVALPISGRMTANQVAVLALLLTAGYFGAVIAQGGLKYINFNILDVYEYRGQAEENLPSIFSYVSSAIGKVFIPFLVVYGIASKKRVLIATGFIIGILLFAFVANRSPLFYGIVSSFLYVFYQNSRKFSFFVIIGLITILVLSALDLSLLLDPAQHGSGLRGLFGSLMVRRAIIVPAQLNSAYIDFFAHNPTVWWADSKITLGLLQSPYSQNIPQVIGQAVFGQPQLGANTGFIGAGYAEGGLIGIVLYSGLIGLFISALNSRAASLSPRFILATSFPVLFTILLSSDLVTAVLTHGVLILLVLLGVVRMPEAFDNVTAPTEAEAAAELGQITALKRQSARARS